jgi:hypothetical protein
MATQQAILAGFDTEGDATQANVDFMISAIQYGIDETATQLQKFKGQETKDERNGTTIFFLKRNHDLARGCILVAEAGLIDTIEVSVRAMYETMLMCQWTILSRDNAIWFREAGERGQSAYLKKTLEGCGRVMNIETGEDTTAQAIAALKANMDGKRSFPKWNKVADDIGLSPHHDILYGQASMNAHGSKYGQIPNSEPFLNQLREQLYWTHSWLRAVSWIADGWVRQKRIMTKAQFLLFLNGVKPDFLA